ncbi:MAG: C1 family peptidase [Nitrospirae bacterium]|nr:C1 family peptidase [Nitrospirota bacterium]
MPRKIKRYGWSRDLPDHRDLKYAAPEEKLQALPAEYDVRDHCPSGRQYPPVYDQGQLGSCTANAIAGAIEFERIKQGLPNFVPSRLFIYFNERVMERTVCCDTGAQIREGIKCVVSQGVCSEDDWSYDIMKFTDPPTQDCYQKALKDKVIRYSSVNQDIKQMKGCIASDYPFIIGISLYKSFDSQEVAKTGVVQMPQKDEEYEGGHAVLVVGYKDSDQRFIVRNSWGQDWGSNGYFTIPYDYLTNNDLADDLWTIRFVE